MITETDIEKALDWLRDSATKCAQDKANRIYAEEFAKSLKAQLMKEHANEALGVQEREARADPKYLRHLEAIREAVRVDEHNRFMREAALAKIEAWRTQSSNLRAEGKAYG